MGYLRFFLAALVAFSHFPGRHLPINLGVSAVVGFYFISGYLMCLSYKRFSEVSRNPIRSFYIDRALRIYPAYLLVFSVSAMWLFYMPIQDEIAGGFLLELAVIPNNFFQITDLVSNTVIPPSWSIGAELQFYILLPLILTVSLKARVILLYLCVIGQLCCFLFGNSVLHYFPGCEHISHLVCSARVSDLLGYRYIIFVMAIFLLGVVAHEHYAKNVVKKHILFGALGLYYLSFFLIFPSHQISKNTHLVEVLVGVMLIIPVAIMALEELRLKRSLGRLDDMLGKLAYPLFLTHFLSLRVVEQLFGGIENNFLYYFESMVFSVVLAYLVMIFQGRIDPLRYKIRGYGRITRQES
jgi:peptidoglycan/LPS O-acetylase OafA/YrhL